MGLNEYDELLENGPAREGSINEYDEMFSSGAERTIAASLHAAAQADPSRQAEVINLSKEFALPTTVVERQYDFLKSLKKKNAHDPEALAKNNPATAQYLSNPDNAGLSMREIDLIKSLEDGVSGKKNAFVEFGEDISGAFQVGSNNLTASYLSLAPAYGLTDGDDVFQEIANFNKRAQDLAAKKPDYAKVWEENFLTESKDVGESARRMVSALESHQDGALRDFASGAVETVGEFLDLTWKSTNGVDKLKGLLYTSVESAAYSLPSIAGAVVGAKVGAQAGLAGGAVAAPFLGLGAIPAGGAVGTVVGTAGGAFTGGVATEVGAWVNSEMTKRGFDMTNAADVKAAYQDPAFVAEIRSQAERKGLGTAAVDALFSMFAGRIKFGKGLAGKVASKTVDVGVQMAGESAGEATGLGYALRDWSKVDAGEVLLEGFASLGSSMVEVAALSPAKSAVEAAVQAREKYSTDPKVAAAAVAADVREALEVTKKIKSIQNAGAAVAQMSDTVMVEGKVAEIVGLASNESSVYFQTDDFDNYFKRKNISPADAAEQMIENGAQKYLEAKENGTPLEVPLGVLLEQTSKDEAALKELTSIARTEPGGMSLQEADKTLKDTPAVVAQIAQESTDESKRVFTQDEIVTKQANEIGREITEQVKSTKKYSDRDARLIGDIYAQRFLRRSKTRGLTPAQMTEARATFIRSASDEISRVVEGDKELFQENKGRIRIGKAQINIDLFELADISTILHETSHAWLEEMRDDYADLKAITGPLTIDQSQFLADAETVLKELGVASFDEITTEHHEAWAKMAEKYFLDGKPPSSKLARAFARFKTWLVMLYKNMSLANVNLSNDMRQVFNRLLASQDQIDEVYGELGMEPLLTSPEDMMTRAEAESYIEAAREARDAASEVLAGKLLDEYRREQTAAYKEKFKEIEAEVTAEIENHRAYRLLEKLQARKGKDQDAFKFDRRALVALLGEDAVKALPRPAIYVAEGGVSPDLIAPMYGYADAKEMLAEIAAMPKKSEAVRAATEARLAANYSSLISNPIEMKEQATAAVHNTKKEELLRTELEFLWKISPKDAKVATAKLIQRLPSTRAIKLEAARIIGRTPVSELKASVYLRAEYRAAKAASDAYKKGDMAAAFNEKRKQVVNFELYKQAQSSLEKIKKAKKLFKKLKQADTKLGKTRDMNLVNAARAILATYGIGDSEKTAEDYLSPMRRYDPEAYETVADIVRAAELPRGRDPEKTSVADFANLMLAIDSLWSLSKTSQEITIGEEKKNINDVREELVEYIGSTFKVDTAATVYRKEKTKWAEVKSKFLGARAFLRKAEHLAFALDLQKLDGIVQKYVTAPVRQAQERFRPVAEAYQKRLVGILENVKITHDKIAAPELRWEFRDKAELLGALMHIGNDSNKKKLLVGYGWGRLREDGSLDSSAWDAFFQRMMREGTITKTDMDAIQAIWNLFEELKPAAQRAFKKINGHYFGEIQATEIETPFGVYRGGYAPAQTDKEIVQDAAARASEKEFLLENFGKMFPASGGDGFGKQRIDNYNKPLVMDIRLAGRHVDQVLRLAMIKPTVIEVVKLINHEDFRNAIMPLDEFAVDDVFMPFLNRVDKQMTQMNISRAGRGAKEFISYVKSGAAMQIMFANFKNIVEQVIQVSVAKVVAPKASIMRAVYNYSMNPKKMRDAAVAASVTMKNRLEGNVIQYRRKMENILTEESRMRKTREWAVDNAYVFQLIAQNHMDVIVWSAVYDSEIAQGHAHETAVEAADKALLLTQGDFSPASKSTVETIPGLDLFQMFYGYFNMMANVNANAYLETVYGRAGLKKKFSLGVYTYFYAMFLPAAWSAVVGKMLAGGFDEDDDDEYVDDIADVFFGAPVRFGTAMIPFVGSAAMAGINRYNDRAWDDRVTASPVGEAISKGFGVFSLVKKDELESRDIKDIMSTIGTFTHLPLGAVSRPIGYAMDVQSGKANPTGPIDFTRGLITGKPGGQ